MDYSNLFELYLKYIDIDWTENIENSVNIPYYFVRNSSYLIPSECFDNFIGIYINKKYEFNLFQLLVRDKMIRKMYQIYSELKIVDKSNKYIVDDELYSEISTIIKSLVLKKLKPQEI